jgi:hypothetical protein
MAGIIFFQAFSGAQVVKIKERESTTRKPFGFFLGYVLSPNASFLFCISSGESLKPSSKFVRSALATFLTCQRRNQMAVYKTYHSSRTQHPLRFLSPSLLFKLDSMWCKCHLRSFADCKISLSYSKGSSINRWECVNSMNRFRSYHRIQFPVHWEKAFSLAQLIS